MKILHAASELVPYSKTGGLADMVAALAKYSSKAGHDVRVVTPLYPCVRTQLTKEQRKLRKAGAVFVPLGEREAGAALWATQLDDGITVYFIEHEVYFNRPFLYGYKRGEETVDYPDNPERFIFFSKCVVELARRDKWKPDVVHAHDWQTGMVPLLIRHQQWSEGWTSAPKTLFTIHNLLYQGLSEAFNFRFTNLPWYYFNPDGAEYWKGLGLLKTGIVFADRLSTVSPRYAKEICTQEFGAGLDGLLTSRERVLSGILNGVDYEVWRTVGNPHLQADYDATDLAGKLTNKLALQAELELPVRPETPLFATVTRIESEKGVELIVEAMEEMLARDLQYVLLGTGRKELVAAVVELGRRHPRNSRILIDFKGPLSHRIEAAADFYVMPSLVEPCGLNQMYSLRYGAIPIVRDTGGLHDTVTDARENTDAADGIKFAGKSGEALAHAVRKALDLYRDPDAFTHYRQNGMSADFSWPRFIPQYDELYAMTLGRA
jgi:starch synthase